MAGKFRTWAANLGNKVKGDVAETLSSEASYARDDIRQKLVEEGWTGNVQTPDTDWEAVKEQAHKEAGIDQLGHTPEQAAAWENHKANAEALYGAPKEKDEGLDIHGNPVEGEDFSGTVWDQENRNGIEPMNVPDIPDQEPDLEPD